MLAYGLAAPVSQNEEDLLSCRYPGTERLGDVAPGDTEGSYGGLRRHAMGRGRPGADIRLHLSLDPDHRRAPHAR